MMRTSKLSDILVILTPQQMVNFLNCVKFPISFIGKCIIYLIMMSIFNKFVNEQRMLTIIPGQLRQHNRAGLGPFLCSVCVIDGRTRHIELLAVIQTHIGDIEDANGHSGFNTKENANICHIVVAFFLNREAAHGCTVDQRGDT